MVEESETLSDRRRVAPHFAREGFVHDRDKGRLSSVAPGEIPAAQELGPGRLEISPGYLETARTELLRGRDFSWRNTAQTPFVAIVNETFARKMWGDTPAIGQRFTFLDHLREVVGVMETGKYLEIQEPAQPMVYLPLTQSEVTYPYFV